MHYSQCSFDSGVKKLPEIIDFYNKTKGGVDCADQMIENYSVAFSTRRWPVVLFCNLLDMAALNGFVIHNEISSSNSPVLTRRLYLKALGKTLGQGYRNQRQSTIPTNLQLEKAKQVYFICY